MLSRPSELPAVFRNERLERRILRLEFRVGAFQHAMAVSLQTLADAVNNNAHAVEFLARAMQAQGEALPGENPVVDTLNAGRGGH